METVTRRDRLISVILSRYTVPSLKSPSMKRLRESIIYLLMLIFHFIGGHLHYHLNMTSELL